MVREARQLLRESDPDALFTYFGGVDDVGHSWGFVSHVRTYLQTIEQVDTHFGRLLQSLQERPTYSNEDWLVVVCVDHCGRGVDHAGAMTF